jgi:hypothetical protein
MLRGVAEVWRNAWCAARRGSWHTRHHQGAGLVVGDAQQCRRQCVLERPDLATIVRRKSGGLAVFFFAATFPGAAAGKQRKLVQRVFEVVTHVRSVRA